MSKKIIFFKDLWMLDELESIIKTSPANTIYSCTDRLMYSQYSGKWHTLETWFSDKSGRSNFDRKFIRCYEKLNPWRPFYTRADLKGAPRKVLYQEGINFAEYLIRSRSDRKFVYEAFYSLPSGAIDSENDPIELTDMRFNSTTDVRHPFSPYQPCIYTDDAWRTLNFKRINEDMIDSTPDGYNPTMVQYIALGRPRKKFWVFVAQSGDIAKVQFRDEHVCDFIIFSRDCKSVYEAFNEPLDQTQTQYTTDVFIDMCMDDSEYIETKMMRLEDNPNAYRGFLMDTPIEETETLPGAILPTINQKPVSIIFEPYNPKEMDIFYQYIRGNFTEHNSPYIVQCTALGNSGMTFYTWAHGRDGSPKPIRTQDKHTADLIIPSKANPKYVYEGFYKPPPGLRLYQTDSPVLLKDMLSYDINY
jgi:hypothetical protein